VEPAINPLPQILPYRGFYGSEASLPDEYLQNLINATRPFWFVIYDGTIGAQQTDRGQVTVQTDCWLLSLIASSQQAAGFVAQLYDAEREVNFMESDVVGVNGFGTAQRQMFLRKPQLLPATGQIQSRVINLATVSNAIQIVGFGYRPDPRKRL